MRQFTKCGVKKERKKAVKKGVINMLNWPRV
jgi:hypothetical protein